MSAMLTSVLQLLHKIEMVFHLAALIPIPYSYRAPTSFVDTNVAGTLNICQAALAAGTQRLVHVSTSEVYGTARYVPIDESHPLQAQSPYSATKIGADAIATSFHRSFGLPVVIARPFNAYGPRQSARAVIPTIISQIASGEQIHRVGRDWRPHGTSPSSRTPHAGCWPSRKWTAAWARYSTSAPTTKSASARCST